MAQVVQIMGAVLILIGFAGAQFRVFTPQSYRYLVSNLLGALVLVSVAFVERQWGFVLLESVWTLVSLWGLWSRSRGQGLVNGNGA